MVVVVCWFSWSPKLSQQSRNVLASTLARYVSKGCSFFKRGSFAHHQNCMIETETMFLRHVGGCVVMVVWVGHFNSLGVGVQKINLSLRDMACFLFCRVCTP